MTRGVLALVATTPVVAAQPSVAAERARHDRIVAHWTPERFQAAVPRDFTLQANSTADLKLVPAAPLFRDWAVTVSCDNGTNANANIFF